MNKLLLAVLVSASVGGCATYGPTWSEISGNRYNMTILDRRPALIANVDGASYSRSARYPIKVEPGQHEILLEGVATTWPSTTPQKLALNLEPCKRYYLNAQFENRVQTNWTPVVDYVEPIAGCPSAGTPR